MFCEYCGAKINDGAIFCHNCGRKIMKVDSSEMPSQESPVVENKGEDMAQGKETEEGCITQKAETGSQPSTEPEPIVEAKKENLVSEKTAEKNGTQQTLAGSQQTQGVEPKRKSMKKGILYGIVAAVVVVLAIAAVSLLGNGEKQTAVTSEAEAIYAKISEDGNAYILIPGEQPIVIDGSGVVQAAISPDRKHIVVILKDNTLYVTDKEQSNDVLFTSDAVAISAVTNDGFFFMNTSDIEKRVLFSDLSSAATLGYFENFAHAQNTTSAIYSTSNGDVYALSSTDSEGEKIGSYTPGWADFKAVSDNGKLAVWTATDNNSQTTLYLSDNGETTVLGKTTGLIPLSPAYFTKDQELLIICSDIDECLWIKFHGKEEIKVQFFEGINGGNGVFTNGVYITDMLARDITSLYVDVYEGSERNVYCISMDGQCEKALENVDDYEIANGVIFYTDQYHDLYSANIEGAIVSDRKQIASAVDGLEMSRNGEYVYFVKDCDDNEGTLFCYKVGEEEPVKVAEDIFITANDYYVWIEVFASMDGSTIFFYQDMERVPVVYEEIGTLMRWNYGDTEVERIADHVVKDSLTSEIRNGIDADNLLFARYAYTDSDYNVFEDWMYYNGEKAVEVAAATRRQ